MNTQYYPFRSKYSYDIWMQKYNHDGIHESWQDLTTKLANEVCGKYLPKGDIADIADIFYHLKALPGGRYLYYAGRPLKAYNNCFLLKAEQDTRQDWAHLSWKAENCLMLGGGIGVDYSRYRSRDMPLKRTGGVASGSVCKMKMLNEIGRQVQQGASRRSALYASLNWKHGDVDELMTSKNWYDMPVRGTPYSIGQLKEFDFNYPAVLDMTNISVNYDTEWIENYKTSGQVGGVFMDNVRQALSTSEPGFSFNFYEKENETLRNACTEITSEDDSDCCNLGSINLSRIKSTHELRYVTEMMTMFLVCGTLEADLPYKKVHDVREKNRRLGLGLTGVHEWLIQRGHQYGMVPELADWMDVFKRESDTTAKGFCDKLGISVPVATRAIAPTGTLSILMNTTSGVEPLFAAAYKRRYLKGKDWHYQYVVEGTSKLMIEQYGVRPDDLETSFDLALDYERRIRFQADVQDYIDHAISSTLNLPAWGTEHNNEDMVEAFAQTVAKYAHRLRGLTTYADSSRGGQPLTPCSYEEATRHSGIEYKEEYADICDITNKSGACAA